MIEPAIIIEVVFDHGDLGIELIIRAAERTREFERLDGAKPVFALDRGFAEQTCRYRVLTVEIERRLVGLFGLLESSKILL